MTSTDTGLGIDAKSDAIFELVEEGSAVEQLATGFTFTEGPIWHPVDGVLYFSDMICRVETQITIVDWLNRRWLSEFRRGKSCVTACLCDRNRAI